MKMLDPLLHFSLTLTLDGQTSTLDEDCFRTQADTNGYASLKIEKSFVKTVEFLLPNNTSVG